MKDLILDTDDPVWKCWVAHVAHLKFVLRPVFEPEDRHVLDKLHADSMRAFEAVPQWQNAGFEKPKMHLPQHLGDVLSEFGPFRAYWCLPFEGFLKMLKRLFRMSNWKSAPYYAVRCSSGLGD